MNVDLQKLSAKPYMIQRHYIATILNQKGSCIVRNAVTTYQQTHTIAFDVALLNQLRHLVDVETAVNYYNRSEPVAQRILARPDSAAVWNEIYNQYIPGIAAQAAAGDAPGAWASIMTMLAQVEFRY